MIFKQKSAKNTRKWSRYGCLLGICGTDGSALVPPQTATAEKREYMEQWLQTILNDIVQTRLQHGLDIEEATPIAICTDSYHVSHPQSTVATQPCLKYFNFQQIYISIYISEPFEKSYGSSQPLLIQTR